MATGRYVHELGMWDDSAPYTGREADSWGHRLVEQGHEVITVGKLHYRNATDPTGFPDQRLPIHVHGGVGNAQGLLRSKGPVHFRSREHVLEAGPGETSYTRYDREIARAAAEWLRREARRIDKPWVLFVSFVAPHFPFIAPERYWNLYSADDVPLPLHFRPSEWSRHPGLDFFRHQHAYDEPIEERDVRKAVRAYYGLVSFMDNLVGHVLDALNDADLSAATRVIYTSDHGEHLGDYGLWKKGTMYESSVGVPLIMSGDGIPADTLRKTNVSLVDLFPTVVESVGASSQAIDLTLPGRSLFGVANTEYVSRSIFSEYHASWSKSAVFMLRDDQYKYVHYVGERPQLFDLQRDPMEEQDLADEEDFRAVLSYLADALLDVVDPEATDRLVKRDQYERIMAAGGPEHLLEESTLEFTPPPTVHDFRKGDRCD